jgi:hypothetical protein
MVSREVWTLPEVSKLLREPQHKLIYLCEKGVVVPDLGEAHGRGSSRRFSKRNLLEFALALALRRLALPVGVVAALTYVLRHFAERLRKSDPGFDIVDSLRANNAPDLRILVRDGEELFFSVSRAGEETRLFGGMDFTSLGGRNRVPPLRKSRNVAAPPIAIFGGPEKSRYVRIEVSVTEIARGLELKT